MICNSYYSFFSNFANRSRFDIIMILKEKPMSVTEICEKLNEEQSKVSHNLKKLTECRVLSVEQAGKNRIYSLNKKTILPILELVGKHVKVNCPHCNKI